MQSESLRPTLDTHLADGFEERLPLNVADRAADLDDHHVGVVLAADQQIRRLISLVMCGTT